MRFVVGDPDLRRRGTDQAVDPHDVESERLGGSSFDAQRAVAAAEANLERELVGLVRDRAVELAVEESRDLAEGGKRWVDGREPPRAERMEGIHGECR